MHPMLSILITTFNSSRTLPRLLDSISCIESSQFEVIVVDNYSTDNTLEICKSYNVKFFLKGPERSAQRNFAACNANGKYLAFIDSDMILDTNFVSDIINVFSSNTYKALVAPEMSFGSGFWAKCKRLERSFYIGVDWMEAARIFQADIFHELRGYDFDNVGTEDYDLPHRLVAMCGPNSIGRISSQIMHDEGRLSLINSCKKKFYYAKRLNVYINKPENQPYFRLQSSILKRYALYFNDPSKLFADPVVGIGMIVLKFCELISGLLGYVFRNNINTTNRSIYK